LIFRDGAGVIARMLHLTVLLQHVNFPEPGISQFLDRNQASPA
jgi:hypothetical protein